MCPSLSTVYFPSWSLLNKDWISCTFTHSTSNFGGLQLWQKHGRIWIFQPNSVTQTCRDRTPQEWQGTGSTHPRAPALFQLFPFLRLVQIHWQLFPHLFLGYILVLRVAVMRRKGFTCPSYCAPQQFCSIRCSESPCQVISRCKSGFWCLGGFRNIPALHSGQPFPQPGAPKSTPNCFFLNSAWISWD